MVLRGLKQRPLKKGLSDRIAFEIATIIKMTLITTGCFKDLPYKSKALVVLTFMFQMICLIVNLKKFMKRPYGLDLVHPHRARSSFTPSGGSGEHIRSWIPSSLAIDFSASNEEM